MKRFSEKYFAIFVAVLSILASIVTIFAFLEPGFIEELIWRLSDHTIFLSFLLSVIAALIVSMYAYFFRKVIKRKKTSIFMSYADTSKEIANKMRKIISLSSSLKIYNFDSIPIGGNIHDEIKKMLDAAEIYVVLFDKQYFESAQCKFELDVIVNSEKVIIPVLTDSEYIKKLPEKIASLRYLVIADNDSWDETFEKSVFEQNLKLRRKSGGRKND